MAPSCGGYSISSPATARWCLTILPRRSHTAIPFCTRRSPLSAFGWEHVNLRHNPAVSTNLAPAPRPCSRRSKTTTREAYSSRKSWAALCRGRSPSASAPGLHPFLNRAAVQAAGIASIPISRPSRQPSLGLAGTARLGRLGAPNRLSGPQPSFAGLVGRFHIPEPIMRNVHLGITSRFAHLPAPSVRHRSYCDPAHNNPVVGRSPCQAQWCHNQ